MLDLFQVTEKNIDMFSIILANIINGGDHTMLEFPIENSHCYLQSRHFNPIIVRQSSGDSYQGSK